MYKHRIHGKLGLQLSFRWVFREKPKQMYPVMGEKQMSKRLGGIKGCKVLFCRRCGIFTLFFFPFFFFVVRRPSWCFLFFTEYLLNAAVGAFRCDPDLLLYSFLRTGLTIAYITGNG